MMLRSCVAGDRGDRRFIRLGGVDSLTSVESVEAHVWRHGVDPVALTASVHDAEACVIAVDLGDAEDDWLPSRPREGIWSVQYELVFPAGPLTWPGDTPDRITVVADHDPS